jgi:FtsH-binding integral membrane protein
MDPRYMEKESSFSHAESLALIESMINKATNRFNEDGFLYLLWGWVVLVCSVTEFVLLRIQFQKHYLVWTLTWAAVLYQIFFLRRKRQKQPVRTYTDDIVKYVWITFIIIMFLAGVLIGTIQGKEYYKLIDPMFLVIYGMPTFLSGIILRFKPLMWGGIGCWALSLLTTVIPVEYHLLLVSAAMVIAWIVPGYLLRLKFKKANP